MIAGYFIMCHHNELVTSQLWQFLHASQRAFGGPPSATRTTRLASSTSYNIINECMAQEEVDHIIFLKHMPVHFTNTMTGLHEVDQADTMEQNQPLSAMLCGLITCGWTFDSFTSDPIPHMTMANSARREPRLLLILYLPYIGSHYSHYPPSPSWSVSKGRSHMLMKT